MNLQIDRIHIALHGVSASMAEAAADGLEAELRRRLGTSGRTEDVAELSLGPLDGRAVLDAAALRGLIAQRLVDALQHRRPEPRELSSRQ